MSHSMPRNACWMFGWLGISLVSMVCLATGCSKSGDSDQAAENPRFEVADDTAGVTADAARDAFDNAGTGTGGGSAAGQPAQPPSVSINELEEITVPEGTPEELMTFINQTGQKVMMAQAEYRGQLPPAMQERSQQHLEAILLAAEKILANGNADQAIRKNAIEAKAGALMVLFQLSGDSKWVDQIRTFGTELAADNDPTIVVEGRTILFGLTIGELAQGGSQGVDALMGQLAAILQLKPLTESVLQISLQAVNSLRSLGHDDRARTAFEQIATAFKDHPDEGLAAESERMFEQLLFLDSEMDAKFRAVTLDREGAADVFLAEYGKLLGQPKPGSMTLDKGATYISLLEQTQHYDLARKMCVMINDVYDTSSDAQLKQAARQITQTALRRVDLLGRPLAIEATRLDGTSLDSSAYRGKVVLVAFFQSSVPRCQQELLGVKTQYEKYHEKGFEVIAVSLDANREPLSRFLSEVNFPWVTVTNNELAEKCGVEMVPFFLLLNQEGNVTDIYVQAASLGQRLAGLYGEAGSVTPPEPNTNRETSDQSRNLRPRPPGGDWSGFVAQALPEPGPPVASAADPPLRRQQDDPSRDVQQQDGAAWDEAEVEPAATPVNPYLPRAGLSDFELISFLFDMQEKPKSIRQRPGFADAIVEAAERVLAASEKERYQLIAADAKFTALHEMACQGNDTADRRLATFVADRQNDGRPEIARCVEFFQLERRALGADQLDLGEIPPLLAELRAYVEARPRLENRHLRLASATVHAINRLPDAEQREQYFAEFGELFSHSEDQQLARYGKRLIGSGKGQVSDLVGKPLELEGITDLGTRFDWSSYRGEVVLVDFWATWCGPCLSEMPYLRALYNRYTADGFDVVAVNLDEDLETFAQYLEENKVPWSNLIGAEARSLAEKYGVRGIPTMILVDKTGQVVAVGAKVETLEPMVRKLLELADH